MIIQLPAQLQATRILQAISNMGSLQDCMNLEKITFCFSKVTSVRATGVTLLHNITRHLNAAGCTVYYTRFRRADSKAMHFLDAIGFFEDHLGKKQFVGSALAETTLRLIEVHHSECHEWISRTFVPWLARCSGHKVEDLSEVEMCMKEIFNNIQDHAGLEIGSVFAQWYPRKQFLDIAICDFGRGIPANVKNILPELSSSECVIKAFEEGFSTRSRPNNMGAGLHLLRQNVVDNLQGVIRMISGGSTVLCDVRNGLRSGNHALGNHGYAGTLFGIRVPTKDLDDDNFEVGDGGIWN